MSPRPPPRAPAPRPRRLLAPCGLLSPTCSLTSETGSKVVSAAIWRLLISFYCCCFERLVLQLCHSIHVCGGDTSSSCGGAVCVRLSVRAAPAVRLPEERETPQGPCTKGGRGREEARVTFGECRGGSETEGSARRPLPGACPGSLHARSARGVSGSPAHPHRHPGTLLHMPRHRGVRAGLARPMSPRRGSARRCPASPPRSRDSPGRPRPGPQPRRHPQLCAPSPEGAGLPSASLAGRGPAVGSGF